MTMPCERTRAVLETRQFLQEQANPEQKKSSIRVANIGINLGTI